MITATLLPSILPTTWTQQVLSIVGLLFALGSLVYVIERFLVSTPYPSGIALIREGPDARRFSLRTRLAYYTDCKNLFQEAWDKYLSQGRPVVLPGMGFRKEVFLPPSQMRWVLSQSDDHLSVPDAMVEIDQAHWSLGHNGPVTDAWQGMLIKTELNRVLESVCAALNDELVVAFDEHFGTDTNVWRDIDLRPTIARAIAQANSRFTVGLPLCRNKEYLQTILDVNAGLMAVGGLLSGFPRILRPVIGPILGFYNQRLITKIKSWLVPLWQQRIALIRRANEKHDEQDALVKEPQDHVQIMARYALLQRPEEVDDHELIVRRICAQNFGAVHQTTIQVVNLLLDILGSDAEYNTIVRLREESDRILNSSTNTSSPSPTNGEVLSEKSANGPANAPSTIGRWTKARVQSMVLADSVSRETLRLHSFANRALMRKVMVHGMKLPSGQELPKGTFTSFLSYQAQTSSNAYDDPLHYNPFRFARMRGNAANGSNVPAGAEGPPVSFVTTSADFLPFGHGKHTCPGRFLVDFELKMIVAYVLRNYDIKFPDEYGGKRPPNVWVTEAAFPPPGVRICLKRKANV